ncbi:MAG: chemotaxis protein CheA [Acidobacteria bacterium]|nr:chemotaxis protein CheA [Acidobacteriota bacterium]
MKIDVTRFHKVYFEESFEGLESMEAGLLALSEGASGDPETINTIFRAAHSIKGGAGSFGFGDVMEFTHLLETLLDQMRAGTRESSKETTACLLKAVDVLREMLEAKRDAQPVAEARIAAAAQLLQNILDMPAGATPEAPSIDEVDQSIWRIDFRPHQHLLKTGNEPIRMFRELASLGQLRVAANVSAVSRLGEMDPEECRLSWNLTLIGMIDEMQIREVFDWVEGDCDLNIVKLGSVEPLAPVATETGTRKATPNLELNETVTAGKAVSIGDGGSIRVSTEKVDAIINLVGELVITQSMLSQFGDQFDISMIEKLRDGLALLARNTRELQETVLKIRMLPISFCFNRFPRMVHDLSAKLGKKIHLKCSGEQTELDKTVLEKINEPLLHLIRNSIDHGIESPEARALAGKPEMGTVQLQASHRGGNVIVEISDDGAGLDLVKILAKARERGLVGPNEHLSKEKTEELIFAPGFSTAAQLSDVSGRGVGMDIVKRNIKELGGNIEIENRPGLGTKFTIKLPLTLAILDGQIVKVGDQAFVVPLVSIVESVQVRRGQVSLISGQEELYRLRDKYIPVLRLYEIFNIPPSVTQLEQGLLMVIEDNGQQAGVFVDDLLAQQQVVIKSMESNFQKVEGISGATILGDGTVSMILDIPGILNLSRQRRVSA